jgi:hypothetical protein
MAFIFHLLNKLMFFFSLPRFESWDNHHHQQQWVLILLVLELTAINLSSSTVVNSLLLHPYSIHFVMQLLIPSGMFFKACISVCVQSQNIRISCLWKYWNWIMYTHLIVNFSSFVSTNVSITSIIFQLRFTVFCRLAHSSECGFIHGDARLMYPTILLMEHVWMPGGIFQASRLETISFICYYCLLFCYMTS